MNRRPSVLLALLLLSSGLAACDLNPQPLPPGERAEGGLLGDNPGTTPNSGEDAGNPNLRDGGTSDATLSPIAALDGGASDASLDSSDASADDGSATDGAQSDATGD